MQITKEQLYSIFPATKKAVLDVYVEPLNDTFEEFKFDNAMSVRVFLAQVGHESAGFNATAENLNYSEQTLLKVFKKYFTSAEAKKFARKPEAIANRVYANRGQNGNESSGDGWRFRGRGLLQITFKSNYSSVAKYFEMSLEDTIKYLETPEGGARAAGWFFAVNNLVSKARLGDMKTVTLRVNGGLNGWDDRMAIFNRTKFYIKD